ncbi:hypothetical protein BVX97_03025 [bacterium E08(2017)]|nr:hypothetical protein BVX97_03025 [bacterium E08(2017)]
MRKVLIKLSVVIVVVTALPFVARANGYKVLCVKGAKATAMGEAFTVQADDPSAIAFNPAGISQLRGNQLNVHATVCNAYMDHTAPGGAKSSNDDTWQTVPSVFITSDFGSENAAWGLGLSFPNGLSSEWSKDSFARYVATYSDLKVGELTPAFGVKINDSLRLGAGLSYFYSEAVLERMVDAGVLAGGLPNGADLLSRLEGDGSAWGGNCGIIYELNDKHGFALTYKLPYSIDYDGDYKLAGSKLDAEATIEFPDVVVVGYAFRPNDKLVVEFNADWTHWGDVGDIEIAIAGQASTPQAQDMRDTFAYKLGAQYSISDSLDIRCGYIYNENATDEATWRPSLPDTDIHFLTAGFGWHGDNITIDTALQLVFYNERTIDNNVDLNEFVSLSSIDGTYETWAPCVSVAATYMF